MSAHRHLGPSPIAADQGRRGMSVDTDAAIAVLSYLMTGPAVFGVIGYGLDRWSGTHVFVAVGILLGLAVSLYIVWLRYGAAAAEGQAPTTPAGAEHARTIASPTTNEESQ